MERESSHRVDELKQKFEETINDELHQPFGRPLKVSMR
jgi:hypothetical protein